MADILFGWFCVTAIFTAAGLIALIKWAVGRV